MYLTCCTRFVRYHLYFVVHSVFTNNAVASRNNSRFQQKIMTVLDSPLGGSILPTMRVSTTQTIGLCAAWCRINLIFNHRAISSISMYHSSFNIIISTSHNTGILGAGPNFYNFETQQPPSMDSRGYFKNITWTKPSTRDTNGDWIMTEPSSEIPPSQLDAKRRLAVKVKSHLHS